MLILNQYISFLKTEVSERVHCSFLKSLNWGYIMVLFNNAVLSWSKGCILYKIHDFRLMSKVISKTIQDRAIVSMECQ